MEILLWILGMYILAVAAYTLITKNSPTNKYIPDFDYWSVIKDGAKGVAIGFAIVALSGLVISQILTWIQLSF